MELIVRKFNDLTVTELFEIYQLREAVFIVEQQCVYQDVDDYDRSAVHVFLKEDGMILAYLLVLPCNTKFDEVSLGRIIAKFLSKDIITEFRGRGDQVHLFPLSFSEFMRAFSGDKREGWFFSEMIMTSRTS